MLNERANAFVTTVNSVSSQPAWSSRYRSVATRALGVLAIIFAVGIAACSKQVDVTATLREAQEKYEEGDLRTAYIQLRGILKEQPDHAGARRLLGKVYLGLGDSIAAEEELRRALRSEPTPETEVWLGRALLRQGRFDTVLEEIGTTSVKSSVISPEMLLVRGEALLAKGELEQAEDLMEDAYQDTAIRGEAAIGLARVSYTAGRVARAHEYAAEAVELVPNNSDAWFMLGLVSYRQEQFAEAEKALSASVERGKEGAPSTLFQPLVLLVETRVRQDDLSGASEAVDQLIAIVPDRPEPYYLQGLLLFQSRDLSGAEHSLRQALNRSPGHPPSLLLLGATLYAQGDYEDARSHLRRFVGLAPTHPQARRLLAAAEMRLGRSDDVLELLEPMVDTGTDDTQLLSMVARASLLSGDMPQAEAYYRQARQADPDNWAVRSALAEVYLAEGALDQAIAELQGAPTKEVEARLMLIRSLAAKGQFDQARDALAEMRKTDPDDPRWLIVAGAIEWMRGDRGAARSNFETALARSSGYVPAKLALGRLAVESGRLEEAERHFRSALAVEPTNSTAMVGMAQISSAGNRKEDAIRWLEQARRANPRELSARLVLGSLYLRSGQVTSAVELAREAESIRPADARVLLLRARAESRAGNGDLALKAYRRLAERLPRSAGVHLERAQVEVMQGRYDDARESIRVARELAPDWPQPRVLLGQLQIGERQFELALRTAKELKESHPHSAAGYLLEGDSLAAQGRLQSALSAYGKAFERKPSRKLALRLASLFREAGQPTKALAVLSSWLREHPDDSIVRQYLAVSYQSLGKDLLAEREYRAVLTADPDNVVALNNLAWLMMDRSPSDAKEYALRAYELAPESAAAADTLGWILLQTGDIEGGRSLLDKAAQNSGDPSIHYHWVVALHKSGAVVEAKRVLSSLLRETKNFPERAEAEKLLKRLERAG